MSVSGLVLGGMASSMGGGFACLLLGHPFFSDPTLELLGMTMGSAVASLFVWHRFKPLRGDADLSAPYHSSPDS